MKKWIAKTDLSFTTLQKKFINTMHRSKNYCTGFFGADIEVFNRFTTLCWIISSNQLTEFYSDQPLVNILISYFGYPFYEMKQTNILHMGNISSDLLRYKSGQLMWDGIVPTAIHFNGVSEEYYKAIITDLERGRDEGRPPIRDLNKQPTYLQRFITYTKFPRLIRAIKSLYISIKR